MRKNCPRCNENYDEALFQKHNSYCTVCYMEYQAQYRETNRDLLLKKQKARRERERKQRKIYEEKQYDWLARYLQEHPCVDCGETDILVLEFDHKDPTQKVCSVGTLRRGSRHKLETEIAKCDVVCANCHKRRTAKQCNSWRLKYI